MPRLGASLKVLRKVDRWKHSRFDRTRGWTCPPRSRLRPRLVRGEVAQQRVEQEHLRRVLEAPSVALARREARRHRGRDWPARRSSHGSASLRAGCSARCRARAGRGGPPAGRPRCNAAPAGPELRVALRRRCCSAGSEAPIASRCRAAPASSAAALRRRPARCSRKGQGLLPSSTRQRSLASRACTTAQRRAPARCLQSTPSAQRGSSRHARRRGARRGPRAAASACAASRTRHQRLPRRALLLRQAPRRARRRRRRPALTRSRPRRTSDATCAAPAARRRERRRAPAASAALPGADGRVPLPPRRHFLCARSSAVVSMRALLQKGATRLGGGSPCRRRPLRVESSRCEPQNRFAESRKLVSRRRLLSRAGVVLRVRQALRSWAIGALIGLRRPFERLQDTPRAQLCAFSMLATSRPVCSSTLPPWKMRTYPRPQVRCATR